MSYLLVVLCAWFLLLASAMMCSVVLRAPICSRAKLGVSVSMKPRQISGTTTYMKVVTALCVAAQLALGVVSYSIESGLARVDQDIIQFGEVEIQLIRQLRLDNMKDKLDVEFKLDYPDASYRPHQCVVTLGDNQGHDLLFVPNYLSAYDVYKLSIPVSKIPLALRIKDKLYLRTIVGSSGPKKHGDNLNRNLAEVIIGDELKLLAQAAYKPAERFGLKHEIHHQFSTDTPTVNATVPIFFSGVAIVLFVGLLGTWTSLLGRNMLVNFRRLSSAQLLYHGVFLTSLVGLVCVFYRYYLGTSIFSTLFHAFLLAIPVVFFGSRTLRDLARFQKLEVS